MPFVPSFKPAAVLQSEKWTSTCSCDIHTHTHTRDGRTHTHTHTHMHTHTEPYWSSLLRTAPLLHMSYAEAEKREMEEADTVTALASLSVAGDMQQRLALPLHDN